MQRLLLVTLLLLSSGISPCIFHSANTHPSPVTGESCDIVTPTDLSQTRSFIQHNLRLPPISRLVTASTSYSFSMDNQPPPPPSTPPSKQPPPSKPPSTHPTTPPATATQTHQPPKQAAAVREDFGEGLWMDKSEQSQAPDVGPYYQQDSAAGRGTGVQRGEQTVEQGWGHTEGGGGTEALLPPERVTKD
eukprot:GHVQ01027270.1.p1 GENE.GHVQ01027270.1~~GHVQ01027270.1.p1  ORF type:complete len:190 (+),score=46.12 GHVQ01027270.1:355-924(+)